MIVVKLQGGLGNQMFQYAFGKASSVKFSKPLYLDRSYLDSKNNAIVTKRHYELDIFSLPVKAGTERLVKKFTNPDRIQRILNAHHLFRKQVYQEPSIAFQDLPKLSANMYLDGYWQSELYFKKIEGDIRRDFQFNRPLNELSGKIKKKLANQTKSVSVHVRRGDYVSSMQASQVHGTCSIEYYKKAFKFFDSLIEHPHYYFFSDDPDWVEQNLVKDLVNFENVRHNTNADSWQDMALMKRCQHHIIANSSFSWWGAWLNPSPQKIVVAPEKWFEQANLNAQSVAIIPNNWIRI